MSDCTPHSTPELQADVADACWGCVEDTRALVAAIPEPERSALEAGLGRCVWNDCGRLEDDPWHGDPDAHEHDPRLTCHPFVPFGAAP